MLAVIKIAMKRRISGGPKKVAGARGGSLLM